jgi:hypothetical protein
MAAITGEREGLVAPADLPARPEDLTDGVAYYTWVRQVERILAERGVLEGLPAGGQRQADGGPLPRLVPRPPRRR